MRGMMEGRREAGRDRELGDTRRRGREGEGEGEGEGVQ